VTTTKIQDLAITDAKVNDLSATKINAGTLQSTNWSTSAGSRFLMDDGTFMMGGSTSPALEWDGATLSIEGVLTASEGGTLGEWTVDGGILVNGASQLSPDFIKGKRFAGVLEGTAVAPTYSFVGDNYLSGMYFTASDSTLRFSVGANDKFIISNSAATMNINMGLFKIVGSPVGAATKYYDLGHTDWWWKDTYSQRFLADLGGPAGAPEYSFVNDPDTGMYASAANKLAFATAATKQMEIDADGAITKPNQPAFLAKPTSLQSNRLYNYTHTVAFGTEVFDLGGDFESSIFTAPVDGKYQLNATVVIGDLDLDALYIVVKIFTSNRIYENIFSVTGNSSDEDYFTAAVSHLADMDDGDTAKIQFYQSGGVSQADIYTNSWFSGYLVC
jgi:hypothetical protein